MEEENIFDKIKEGSDDEPYWSAYKLYSLLGYSSYQKFKKVIQRAMKNLDDKDNLKGHFHLIQQDKMNKSGKYEVYYLSKYACYLVALSAAHRLDKIKNEIKEALEYFNPDSLNQKYIDEYTNKANEINKGKINKLENNADFIRDDTYQKDGKRVPSDHHIMFKLKSRGEKIYYEAVPKNDGFCINYEFLVEYSTKKPSEGIYYGCKGFIEHDSKENREKLCQIMDDEWNEIKKTVCIVLDNIFPNKKFTNRFKITDNVNNGNYWPFWISLYEDENIDVAVIVLQAIKRVYEKEVFELSVENLTTYNPFRIEKDEGCAETETRFTNDAFEEVLKKISNKYNNINVKDDFQRFLEGAEKKHIIEKSIFYEKGWNMGCKNQEFAYLLRLLFDFFRSKFKPELDDSKDVVNWDSMVKIFLDVEGRAIAKGNSLGRILGSKEEPRIKRDQELKLKKQFDKIMRI